MSSRILHNIRRAAQTFRYFDNGPQLIRRLPFRHSGQAVAFHVRSGPVMWCPNQPGARVPVYEVFAEDAYRLDWLGTDLPDRPRVLDIGGHIGCFSVAMARRVPESTIDSYEASPSTAVWLRRNVEANGLGQRVAVHAEAVSDRAGTVSFQDNAGGSSLNRLTETASTVTESAVTVPCVSLADAFSVNGTGPDLVKIDTEGAEYTMVLASRPELWRGVRKVVLEYHDVPGHDWAELAEFFAVAGLQVVDRVEENARQGTAWLDRKR